MFALEPVVRQQLVEGEEEGISVDADKINFDSTILGLLLDSSSSPSVHS